MSKLEPLLEPLLERNRAFAANGTHTGVVAIPRFSVIVITCFDPRVDPSHIFDLDLGDISVIRNPGGRITPDVLFQIGLLATMTEGMLNGQVPPVEVAIVHHTKCGTQALASADFRQTVSDLTKVDVDDLADLVVMDPHDTVAHDVALLSASPTLPSWATVSGYAYDVDTGLVTPANTKQTQPQDDE